MSSPSNLNSYLRLHSDELAERILASYPPLHGMDDRPSPALSQMLRKWAAQQPGAHLEGPTTKTANVVGVPSKVYGWELGRGPGETGETLMAIVAGLADSSMTELRLVRAVGNR